MLKDSSVVFFYLLNIDKSLRGAMKRDGEAFGDNILWVFTTLILELIENSKHGGD